MPAVREVRELPSVVTDMEPETPSKSVNRVDNTSHKFVNQDNKPLSDMDDLNQESSIKSKLKNFFKKKK